MQNIYISFSMSVNICSPAQGDSLIINSFPITQTWQTASAWMSGVQLHLLAPGAPCASACKGSDSSPSANTSHNLSLLRSFFFHEPFLCPPFPCTWRWCKQLLLLVDFLVLDTLSQEIFYQTWEEERELTVFCSCSWTFWAWESGDCRRGWRWADQEIMEQQEF